MLLVGRFVVCSKGGRGREADKGGAAMWPRCLSARARPNSLLLLCLDLARPYRRRAASPRPQGSPGAAVSPPGSSGPFGALLGEFSCFPCFDRLLMRSDAPDNFFGRHLASSSRLGIPDACASSSVSFPSQLVIDILPLELDARRYVWSLYGFVWWRWRPRGTLWYVVDDPFVVLISKNSPRRRPSMRQRPRSLPLNRVALTTSPSVSAPALSSATLPFRSVKVLPPGSTWTWMESRAASYSASDGSWGSPGVRPLSATSPAPCAPSLNHIRSVGSPAAAFVRPDPSSGLLVPLPHAPSCIGLLGVRGRYPSTPFAGPRRCLTRSSSSGGSTGYLWSTFVVAVVARGLCAFRRHSRNLLPDLLDALDPLFAISRPVPSGLSDGSVGSSG